MNIRVLVAMAGVLLSVTAVACSEDADTPNVTPTVTVADSSPYATTVTDPTPTPHATPIAEAATLDGCPVDDAALCQFALDAQDALNAEDMEFFVSRLSPFSADCRGVSLGPLPGCDGTTPGPSGPVVGVIGTASDCCLVVSEEFEARFQERLDRLRIDGAWRLYGIERRTDHDRVIVVSGNGTNAAMVSIGTTSDGSLGIPTVIVGPMSHLFVYPDSEFSFWR